MNDVIKCVALVPIACSSNIVTNRSFYAQSNLINNIGRCYILGQRSLLALTLMSNLSYLYQTVFLSNISCYVSATCQFIAVLLSGELCKAKCAFAREKVSQSTKKSKFHSILMILINDNKDRKKEQRKAVIDVNRRMNRLKNCYHVGPTVGQMTTMNFFQITRIILQCFEKHRQAQSPLF